MNNQQQQTTQIGAIQEKKAKSSLAIEEVDEDIIRQLFEVIIIYSYIKNVLMDNKYIYIVEIKSDA